MTKDEISHHVEGEDSEAFRKLRRSFGLADAHGLTKGQRADVCSTVLSRRIQARRHRWATPWMVRNAAPLNELAK